MLPEQILENGQTGGLVFRPAVLLAVLHTGRMSGLQTADYPPTSLLGLGERLLLSVQASQHICELQLDPAGVSGHSYFQSSAFLGLISGVIRAGVQIGGALGQSAQSVVAAGSVVQSDEDGARTDQVALGGNGLQELFGFVQHRQGLVGVAVIDGPKRRVEIVAEWGLEESVHFIQV